MKHRLVREEGQQLIQVALLLPVLLAFLGLALDVGNVYVHHRMVQNAVDAAAAAAGMVLYQSGATVATATARYYANLHGYDNNGTTNIVQVSVPPTGGTYAGNPHYIQVRIQESVTPIFAALVWRGTFQVSASGTAGYTVEALGADVIVLKDSSAPPCSPTTTMNGNQGVLQAVNGTVQVNSPCPAALSNGNGDIYAGEINIVGGYSSGPNGVLSPTPHTGAPAIPDPLLSLPTPDSPHSESNCPTRTGPVSGKYLPGVYQSSFSPNFDYPFDGSSGQCNGVFIFNAGLNATGGHKTITINNGMFYFASGGITLGGNGSLQGTAPTSGPYAGMLIFGARNNYSTFELHGTPQASGCSSTTANTKGIVYLPKGGMTLLGTSDACFAGAFIVWTLDMTGNATTTVQAYSGTAPGTTVTDALVE
jgi:Flp pilus assembly protein TadG